MIIIGDVKRNTTSFPPSQAHPTNS